MFKPVLIAGLLCIHFNAHANNANVDQLMQRYRALMEPSTSANTAQPMVKDTPSIWQTVEEKLKKIKDKQRGQFQSTHDYEAQQQLARQALETELNAMLQTQSGFLTQALNETERWLTSWWKKTEDPVVAQAKLDFYKAGTASMIDYDPDTARLRVDLAWRGAVQHLFRNLPQSSQYISIDPAAAKHAFKLQKIHPIFIQVSVQANGLSLENSFVFANNQQYSLQALQNDSDKQSLGNPKINQPERYQIQARDSIILDTQTNLFWMRCTFGQHWDGETCQGNAEEMSWQTAQSLRQYVYGKTWRLPSIAELRTLVRCSSGNPAWSYSGREELQNCIDSVSPTIDQYIFPNTPSGVFWSASPVADSEKVWNVFFKNGRDYRGDKSLSDHRYARLVANP